MIELPTRRGEPYKVTAYEIRELEQAYPRVDVKEELGKMRQWLLANPSRRKSNTKRFIANWLSRAKPTVHNAAARAPEPEPLPGYTADPSVAEKCIAEAKKIMGMR